MIEQVTRAVPVAVGVAWWQDKNEVGLAARAAMLRARSGASILDCDRDALHALFFSFTTVLL